MHVLELHTLLRLTSPSVIFIPVKYKEVPALHAGKLFQPIMQHHFMYLLAPIFECYYITYLQSSGTTGYVVLSPQGNYTVFENNIHQVFLLFLRWLCSSADFKWLWSSTCSSRNIIHM